nr:MAG: DNA pilot protein [Microviridae sp.]
MGNVLGGVASALKGVATSNPVGILSGIGDIVGQGLNFFNQNSLQQQSWAREDNAVQRRAKDLEAAGLSKTLAAGSPAQTMAPIRMDVPNIGTSIDRGQNAALSQLALMRQKVDISKTLADTKSVQLQNQYLDETLKDRSTTVAQQLGNLIKEGQGQSLGLTSKEIENAIKRYDFNFYQKLGLPTNSNLGEKERIGVIVANAIGSLMGSQKQQPIGGQAMSDYMNSPHVGPGLNKRYVRPNIPFVQKKN